ncbi:MAG: alkaline phosphatase family protein [Methylocella sp.]
MTRLQSIEHFVVLMLENRSFDNLLGGLYPKSKDFDGVDGSESNQDRSGKAWPLTETPGGDAAGLSVPNPDPGELWADINVQIFGSGQLHGGEPYPPRDGAVAGMCGFVDSYTDPNGRPSRFGNDARQIMSRYKPERDVPALATLAREFAVCDSWFASAPNQTWPNRFFVHTGTAAGYENNKPDKLFFKMPTVFGSFDRAPSKPSWAVYHHDVPQTLTLLELIGNAQNFHMFDKFVKHARAGVLPNYSFIEPRYYTDVSLFPPRINLPNDMHPPHIVCFGDQLVATVYNALRSNVDAWKKTMLVIVFDEHGGCYDHAPPPKAIPPGPVVGENPNPIFTFDRYGVRVPAVIASPYIQPGTILRPSDNYPEDGATPFDHASVINTLRHRFELGAPLTARVEAAPTLERVLNRDTPENLGPETIAASDCKVSLFYKIKCQFELWNDFQASLHDMARKLPTADHGRAQVFLGRHVTRDDPQKPDGVHSSFGAMWRHGTYLAMKPFGWRR